VAEPLENALDRKVAFAEDCIGPKAREAVAALKDGDVLLLENTRFHKGEEDNDDAMARELAALGDIFVNDAFSAAHRAHAFGIAEVLYPDWNAVERPTIPTCYYFGLRDPRLRKRLGFRDRGETPEDGIEVGNAVQHLLRQIERGQFARGNPPRDCLKARVTDGFPASARRGSSGKAEGGERKRRAD